MQNNEYRMIRSLFLLSFLSFFFFARCQSAESEARLKLGASRTDLYLPEIEGKSVGLLINHTSVLNEKHLVDFLMEQGVQIKTIFAPEHGFRGTADAGEHVKDNVDEKTGIPVVSLYGNNKKPSADQLSELDVVIFDIQDVGVRFYTYISSMHYMMEACAENGVKMIVFDRPNPNGHIVDGPILDPDYKSFVGMHPIPVVHGLTVGELAKMINEESWLEGGIKCELLVIPMQNYKHSDVYSLPIKPSPNLPNDQSIMLYPSLCFFEGTQMSIGRGTYFPFQVIGYPDSTFGAFTFTPVSIDGMAKSPRYENKVCYGVDLRSAAAPDKLDLGFVIDFYNKWDKEEEFFTKYFNTLAGTNQLKKQIESGKSEEEIRASWQSELEKYKALRKKYLMYEEK
jgi:uncharacterized protein YbbC (DUF1343 family)